VADHGTRCCAADLGSVGDRPDGPDEDIACRPTLRADVDRLVERHAAGIVADGTEVEVLRYHGIFTNVDFAKRGEHYIVVFPRDLDRGAGQDGAPDARQIAAAAIRRHATKICFGGETSAVGGSA
jgi:hypothetical protein